MLIRINRCHCDGLGVGFVSKQSLKLDGVLKLGGQRDGCTGVRVG